MTRRLVPFLVSFALFGLVLAIHYQAAAAHEARLQAIQTANSAQALCNAAVSSQTWRWVEMPGPNGTVPTLCGSPVENAGSLSATEPPPLPTTVPTPPAGRPHHPLWPWVLGGLAVACVWSLVRFWRRPPSMDPATAQDAPQRPLRASSPKHEEAP